MLVSYRFWFSNNKSMPTKTIYTIAKIIICLK